MAQFKLTSEYEDGTRRILETSDGARAMSEASNAGWEEELKKTVTLEKDGDVIWSEKIKAYKSK